MGTCYLPECDRESKARGMCLKHWKRWRRNGDPTVIPPRPRKPVEVRFWPKVAKGDGCWEWTAYRDPDWGYGIFRVTNAQNMQKAHRVSWEITNGPIPDGLQVLHRCDNPPCVRPDHLFLGTHDDNMADRDAKGRQSRAGGIPGEANTSAVLSDAQVREIRERYETGRWLQRELAAEYGITQSTVSGMVRGAQRADTFTGQQRTFKPRRGPNRKLTPQQEATIRARRTSGEVLRTIAADYGVSMSLVCLITKREAVPRPPAGRAAT